MHVDCGMDTRLVIALIVNVRNDLFVPFNNKYEEDTVA
jgi:hypothetical protein